MEPRSGAAPRSARGGSLLRQVLCVALQNEMPSSLLFLFSPKSDVTESALVWNEDAGCCAENNFMSCQFKTVNIQTKKKKSIF